MTSRPASVIAMYWASVVKADMVAGLFDDQTIGEPFNSITPASR
jgi:hypothetical protein